jgi:hypothetical protein
MKTLFKNVAMQAVALMLLISFAIGFLSTDSPAAQFIQRQITSRIIRPAGTRASDSNGLVRLYSANESNWFAIDTNLDFIWFTPTGSRTGQTILTVNSNVAGGLWTNTYRSGALVRTNLGGL